MIAVTARRILTLLALVAPAPGRARRDAGQAAGCTTGRAPDRASRPAAPDAVVFRHYL